MAGRGGKRKGAGRKPKADEIKTAEKITNVITEPELVNNLAEIARTAKRDSDRIKANEILLGYLWGKPNQKVQNEVTIEEKPRPDWMDESEP